MYILKYFLKKGSAKNDATVSFNNTVAGLDQSWSKFNEQLSGAMYDLGTWLAKTYEDYTKKTTTHNLNTQVEIVQKREEIEMDAFINDSQDGEWEQINHIDCPLPDEKFDMSKGKIVENEQPGTNISITGKVSDFIGRLLG